MRMALDIVLFVGLFIFPFWLFAGVALLGLVLISYYFEFFIALVLLELLYRGGHSHIEIYLILSAALLFIGTQALRAFIRDRAPNF